jgi:transcriptional regulator with XRE-family HTH domain
MNTCEAVAKRIKQLLKEKKMTQYRLEQNSGIQHGSMDCILKGKNKSVQLNTVMMIANGFDMSFIDFLNDELFFSEELELE